MSCAVSSVSQYCSIEVPLATTLSHHHQIWRLQWERPRSVRVSGQTGELSSAGCLSFAYGKASNVTWEWGRQILKLLWQRSPGMVEASSSVKRSTFTKLHWKPLGPCKAKMDTQPCCSGFECHQIELFLFSMDYLKRNWTAPLIHTESIWPAFFQRQTDTWRLLNAKGPVKKVGCYHCFRAAPIHAQRDVPDLFDFKHRKQHRLQCIHCLKCWVADVWWDGMSHELPFHFPKIRICWFPKLRVEPLTTCQSMNQISQIKWKLQWLTQIIFELVIFESLAVLKERLDSDLYYSRNRNVIVLKRKCFLYICLWIGI